MKIRIDLVGTKPHTAFEFAKQNFDLYPKVGSIEQRHHYKYEVKVTLNIGNFVQTVFDFSLMALAVFIMIKFINRLKRQKDDEILETPVPEEAPAPPAQEVLLAEIRDLLKAGASGQKPPQS